MTRAVNVHVSKFLLVPAFAEEARSFEILSALHVTLCLIRTAAMLALRPAWRGPLLVALTLVALALTSPTLRALSASLFRPVLSASTLLRTAAMRTILLRAVSFGLTLMGA